MPPAQAVGRRLSRIAGHTRAQPAAAVVQEPPVPDNSTAHPRRFAADPEAADEQAAFFVQHGYVRALRQSKSLATEFVRRFSACAFRV